MKILSGQLKGRNFYMPAGISPTKNLLRKAVFDILGDISGADFLELFAGSGAVGWEAFSRGAKTVTLVEREPRCVEVIHENLRLLGIDQLSSIMDSHPHKGEGNTLDTSGQLTIIPADVFVAIKQLAKNDKKYDIVFLDPPFGVGLGKKALKALGAYDILHPNCFLLIQVEKNEIFPAQEGRFHLIKEKKYGVSHLWVYTKKYQMVHQSPEPQGSSF